MNIVSFAKGLGQPLQIIIGDDTFGGDNHCNNDDYWYEYFCNYDCWDDNCWDDKYCDDNDCNHNHDDDCMQAMIIARMIIAIIIFAMIVIPMSFVPQKSKKE